MRSSQILLLALLVSLSGCGGFFGGAFGTPVPMQSSQVTNATSTGTATATDTATSSPTGTPGQTDTATDSEPTDASTTEQSEPSPTSTPTSAPTPTRTATATPSPTATPEENDAPSLTQRLRSQGVDEPEILRSPDDSGRHLLVYVNPYLSFQVQDTWCERWDQGSLDSGETDVMAAVLGSLQPYPVVSTDEYRGADESGARHVITYDSEVGADSSAWGALGEEAKAVTYGYCNHLNDR